MSNHTLRIDFITLSSGSLLRPSTHQPQHGIVRSPGLSAQHNHTRRQARAKCFGHDASRCFFALLSLVPKRLTAAQTVRDGEVPSVGEVGWWQHRIHPRERPCMSRHTLDRCHGHCTAHTNAKPLPHRPAHTPKKTSVLHVGRTSEATVIECLRGKCVGHDIFQYCAENQGSYV